MENRIDIADGLKTVSLDLAGVSQLLMFTYETLRNDGLDAEHLIVLAGVTDRCRDELGRLREMLP